MLGLLLTLVAGVLGWLSPYAIRRLPEPAPEVEATPEVQPALEVEPAPEVEPVETTPEVEPVETTTVHGFRQPQPPAEPETELQRMLREEGPKETYLSVGSIRGLAPVSALVSMGLAVATWYALCHQPGGHRVAGVIMLLTPVLVTLSVIDARTRLLPRRVVLPATGVLLVLALVEWAATRATHVLVRELVAMLIARSCFWILWFIRQAGMGFGDVRLAALVGLVLGRVGWSAWVVGLYGGLLVFVVFGVGLAVVRRDRSTLKKAFPYGPFMVAGLFLGVLTSGSITIM